MPPFTEVLMCLVETLQYHLVIPYKYRAQSIYVNQNTEHYSIIEQIFLYHIPNLDTSFFPLQSYSSKNGSGILNWGKNRTAIWEWLKNPETVKENWQSEGVL